MKGLTRAQQQLREERALRGYSPRKLWVNLRGSHHRWSARVCGGMAPPNWPEIARCCQYAPTLAVQARLERQNKEVSR